jgi:sulfite reductase alpha subunit-like flavoprotein
MERDRLRELLDPANQQDLFNYCHRPRRTCLETLRDFPHAARAVPLPYFFDLFAPIKPRAFSIASSSLALPGRLQLLVAVVEYKTRMQVPRRGLCSTWLSRAVPGVTRVPIWTRGGTFTFPEVCNGTVFSRIGFPQFHEVCTRSPSSILSASIFFLF